MKLKNNSKIFGVAIISTFLLGIVCFGMAIQHDYKNTEGKMSGMEYSSSYLIR